MELAACDLAFDVVAASVLAHRAQLGRERLPFLEPVHRRRDVHERAEPRVRDRAVVALEEVLGNELPVRLDGRRCTVAELELLDVHARLGDEVGQPAEHLPQRRRLRVRAREHERAPRPDRRRTEAEPLRFHTAFPVGPRRRHEPPVEAICPGVVRALKRRTAPLALGDERAAVPADVQECAQLTAAVAGDHDRDVPHRRGEVPGALQLSEPPDVLPRAREDRRPLVLERRRVAV